MRAALAILAVGAVVIFGAIALGAGRAASAQRPAPREWWGLAGRANHACYSHGGVRQLFGPTGGGTGLTSETDVVCLDGWAVNVVRDSQYPIYYGDR